MKIAHWHSRDAHPTEQLDYSNLLGACMGNEGQPRSRQHCDTRQANRDISRNPAQATHRVETYIRFDGNGRVSSQDATFDKDLNDVLNLNVAHLVSNRRAKVEALKMTLEKRGHLDRATLERLLRRWNGESHANELEPYCQVIVYWLRKRLARAA